MPAGPLLVGHTQTSKAALAQIQRRHPFQHQIDIVNSSITKIPPVQPDAIARRNRTGMEKSSDPRAHGIMACLQPSGLRTE